MTENATDFAGLTVAAFESRRAEELASLIRRRGGVPRVSPSMCEVAPARNPEAIDFANRVITGQIEVIIFTTGVGVRQFIEQTQRHVPRDRLLAAISDVVTLARGSKPAAALKEFGLVPTYRTAEPDTWRELLAVVDQHLNPANLTIGLQEYGEPNTSLIAGLEARGARVARLELYKYELPVNVQPLEENIRALAAAQVDVCLFTSGHQVVNLLEIARRLGLENDARRGLARAVIASIGPSTSEALRRESVSVDFEPEVPKMGQLVATAAQKSGEMLTRKRRVAAIIDQASSTSDAAKPAWYDSPFMKACRREPCDRVPIWLMRQAGRYMPEYRQVREKTTFLELCKNPGLCAEVMVTAVNRLGVDAAIIFSDLLPILEPMGLDLEFAQGEGPVIHNPVRQARDVDRVFELESAESLDFVMETVRLTRAAVRPEIPVIGFAGAPFTLASYVIEGGASRSYLHTKTLMYRDEGAWNELMGRLGRSVTRYLNAQIAAGAQAVQLFDSWAGCLSPADYRRYVLPHTRAIVEGLDPGAPLINFATGNPALLPLLSEAGGEVIGIDWRISLDDAWRTVGYEKAVQGNLDPLVLLADRDEIRRRAAEVLKQAAGRPGHIFNLGHGILPQTPVENAIALVNAVHELGPMVNESDR